MASNTLPNYYQHQNPSQNYHGYQPQPNPGTYDPRIQQPPPPEAFQQAVDSHQPYHIQQPSAIPYYQAAQVGQPQVPPPLTYRSHSTHLPLSPYTPSHPYPQQNHSAPFQQNTFPGTSPNGLPPHPINIPPTTNHFSPTGNPYPSPTSPRDPTHTSPTRRPLPQPQSVGRSATTVSPGRRPLPTLNGAHPTPSPSLLQRPATAMASTSSTIQDRISRFNTLGSSQSPPLPSVANHSHSPRPLPTPAAQLSQGSDPSAVKQMVSNFSPIQQQPPPPRPRPLRTGAESAPPHQPRPKFVPMWKRALPSPLAIPSDSNTSHAPPMERRGTVAGYAPTAIHQDQPVASAVHNGVVVERSKTTVRPLPSFPPGGGKPTESRQPSPSKRASEMFPQKPPSVEVNTHRRGNSMEIQSTARSPPSTSYSALRDRSRTLPAQAPPPTGALPSRPFSMMKKPAAGAAISESPEPVSDSDDESISNNALLTRRSPIRLPSEVPQSSQNPRTPSPTYGIRELPFRTKSGSEHTRGTSPSRITITRPQPSPIASTPPTFQTSPPVTSKSSNPRAPRPAFDPPFQSAILRLAQMSLDEEKRQASSGPIGDSNSSSTFQHPMPTMSRSFAQSGVDVPWPANLPRLPRAPGSLPQPPISPTRPASSSRTSSPSRSPTRSSVPPPLPPRKQSFSSSAAPVPSTFRNTSKHVLPNIDDAPPPSLRRTPSPSSQHGLPPTYSRHPPHPVTQPSPQRFSQPLPKPQVPSLISEHASSEVVSQPSPTRSKFWSNGNSGISQRGGNANESARQPLPKVSFPASPESDSDDSLYATPSPTPAPVISVSGPGSMDPPKIAINGFGGDGEDQGDGPQVPIISIGGIEDPSPSPKISVSSPRSPLSGGGGSTSASSSSSSRPHKLPMHPALRGRGGLVCGGCGGALLGRIVNAMGARWHPGCFRCCICNELLENLSSYEHDGRPYCHLDYHEVRFDVQL